MSNQEFYGGQQGGYPQQQPYGAPPQGYPPQPQYAPSPNSYPPAPDYVNSPPPNAYPPPNIQPPYGAAAPSPAHSPSPYGHPSYPQGAPPAPYQQGSPYPPQDPYSNQLHQGSPYPPQDPYQNQLQPYGDNRAYTPTNAAPYGAPTYNEPGAGIPPGMEGQVGPNGEKGLGTMALGAGAGFLGARHTGGGFFKTALAMGAGAIAAEFAGKKIKKYRKDHRGRDIEYYEDERGNEVPPPGYTPSQSPQPGGLHPGYIPDNKQGGWSGYGEEPQRPHSSHSHHSHHHGHHHGHRSRSHSRDGRRDDY